MTLEEMKARVYDILVETAKLQREQQELEQKILNYKDEKKPTGDN